MTRPPRKLRKLRRMVGETDAKMTDELGRGIPQSPGRIQRAEYLRHLEWAKRHGWYASVDKHLGAETKSEQSIANGTGEKRQAQQFLGIQPRSREAHAAARGVKKRAKRGNKI